MSLPGFEIECLLLAWKTLLCLLFSDVCGKSIPIRCILLLVHAHSIKNPGRIASQPVESHVAGSLLENEDFERSLERLPGRVSFLRRITVTVTAQLAIAVVAFFLQGLVKGAVVPPLDAVPRNGVWDIFRTHVGDNTPVELVCRHPVENILCNKVPGAGNVEQTRYSPFIGGLGRVELDDEVISGLVRQPFQRRIERGHGCAREVTAA